MRQFLIDTLKLLESRVRPPEHCHHALTYARYGSDNDGWSDRLALQVNRNGTFYCLFLDSADLEKTPKALVDDIVAVLHAIPEEVCSSK